MDLASLGYFCWFPLCFVFFGFSLYVVVGCLFFALGIGSKPGSKPGLFDSIVVVLQTET